MAQFALKDIRNVVLLGHNGSGKSALSEAILFTAGAINRLGKIEEGTTTSDYDPDEVKYKMSINLSMLPCEWNNTKVNIIDTPGYSDFLGEVKAAIRVAEGSIIVVSALSGVEVGTEQVWQYIEDAKLARLILVNKMDRENANFDQSVTQIQAKFGNRCAPLQMPIGAHTSYQGVIDLLEMKAYTGNPPKEEDVPADMQAQAAKYREKLIEAVAETDDKLLEKYLGGEEINTEELTAALRTAVMSGKVVPILAASSLQNVGVSKLLDVIVAYLPSPAERKVTVTKDNTEQTIEPDDSAPLSSLVFKATADPYVGKLTYFRVYTGAINSNSQVWNANKGAAERVGQLYLVRGKTQEAVPQVKAGDIGAVAKLAVTGVGDTLCTQENQVIITPIIFPDPVFSEAIHPKTKADLDKLGTSLARLLEEDPTLRMHRDAGTNETILSGLGETHLKVAADKMTRKFGVSIELSIPKVPYRETILGTAQAEYKHKKQTGGHGQYGHAVLAVEPMERGGGFEFVDKIVGGAIPRNYIPAVEKGIREGILEGVLAGYPVIDIRATAVDGSFHPVDSSEICFKIAGAGALKKGMQQANPVILEPIMDISIRVPKDFIGDIISDLNTKRARVQGMNPEGEYTVVEAQVPQAEILRYAIDLKSITQGRGSFTMKFSHYEEVPAHISQKVIADAQAAKEAAAG
ncbi:MAG: elongation factor G [Dehalococcoidales bacterium]|nr:elongation factor G [Dehalococcoidales bacterium]